jgi:hypothetical protein
MCSQFASDLLNAQDINGNYFLDSSHCGRFHPIACLNGSFNPLEHTTHSMPQSKAILDMALPRVMGALLLQP